MISQVGTENFVAVTTRAQEKQDRRGLKPLHAIKIEGLDCEPENFLEWQKEDKSLASSWGKARRSSEEQEKHEPHPFFIKNEFLYRKYLNSEDGVENDQTQLMVPKQLRAKVLNLAHASILGAHMSYLKTIKRIGSKFSWPSMCSDTKRFVQSCEICQKTCSQSVVKKAPLQTLTLAEHPFQHVYIDLIGEIVPKSDRGHRWILCLVDGATRYADATCLKKIDTETVAEALLSMFSRIGFPERITSDLGQQFISDKMKEVYRLLSIKHIHTSPYHAMANGVCERFNGSLKKILKRLTHEKVSDWDRYVDACLFAYRETPHSSTGYSPFDLIGRTVRGPMSILRQLWTKETIDPEIKTSYQYVLDLKDKIESTCEIARAELAKSQQQNKKYFDKKAKHRSFSEGDQVLVLLSVEKNKLEMSWTGPFVVVSRIGLYNYKIRSNQGKIKTYHINMLKKWYQRDHVDDSSGTDRTQTGLSDDIVSPDTVIDHVCVVASVIDEDVDDSSGLSLKDNDMYIHYNTVQKEDFHDVKVNPELSVCKRKEVESLIEEYQDIFTDVPKVTNLGKHKIVLKQNEIVQSKPYPIPIHMREVLDKEIDQMLSLGIIVPSSSYYSSPVVMVRKPDGSTRVCVNYKKLNNISLTEVTPMNQTNDILDKIGGSKLYSKFDLSKGFYGVALDPESMDKSSFVCSRGQFNFTVMPFGLSSAPMSFSRIMRKLLDNAAGLENYLDDVLAYSKTWPEHMETLKYFFSRVRETNLALRPSKCQIGYGTLDFLGHRVIEDSRTPNPENLNKIFEATRPKTKTQIRSFLGLTGFFQNYIGQYSDKAKALTDLLRGKGPEQIIWGPEQEKSFQILKEHLLTSPILKLPRMDRPFVLRCDASKYAVGVTAMQEHDGKLFPVSYASKKLSPREVNYSISQREALSIVFGCQKFHRYVYGTKFVVQTDHKPLTVLKGADTCCPRLQRWALILQSYDFVTQVIPGTENIGADFLSRHF